MAIHKSAQKRIRQTTRITAQKKARTSDLRTAIRKVEEAVKSGDKAAAADALKAAQPKIQRGALKGVMHKKTASRKISRLSKKVKSISA